MTALPDPLLQALVARLHIAHHIPGRIRLKLEQALSETQAQAIGDAQRLIASLADLPGIHKVGLNLLARSCTIEYDPARIAPAGWEHLVSGVDSSEASALIALLGKRPAR